MFEHIVPNHQKSILDRVAAQPPRPESGAKSQRSEFRNEVMSLLVFSGSPARSASGPWGWVPNPHPHRHDSISRPHLLVVAVREPSCVVPLFLTILGGRDLSGATRHQRWRLASRAARTLAVLEPPHDALLVVLVLAR